MDILLENGDVSITSSGQYVFVKGIDQVLERAILCAKIRKGSFIYNKALGTELFSADTEKTATMLINEALMGTEDFCTEVESIEKTPDGRLLLWLAVKNEEETKRAQVTLNANL